MEQLGPDAELPGVVSDVLRLLHGITRGDRTQDEERPGMQMSVRLSFKRNGQMIGPPRVTYTSPDAPADSRDVYHDAIMAALDRCTPMPFSAGLGGAIAGRPIAIRYVENRNLPHAEGKP